MDVLLGLDLAWSDRNPSGAVALRRGDDGVWRATSETALGGDREILDWIDGQVAGSGALLAIDAPLVAPNPAGTGRPCDRRMSEVFGRFHASAHSANRAVAKRPVRLARLLREFGWRVDPRARAPRRAIEVYPHAACIGLFGLERIVKYKKGTTAEKVRGLEQLQGLIRLWLPQLDPPIEAPPLRDLRSLRGWRRKDLEDKLDAWICAAMAAQWTFQTDLCEVFGDTATGFVVVPRLWE